MAEPSNMENNIRYTNLKLNEMHFSLVRHNRTQSLHDGHRREILARDKLDAAHLCRLRRRFLKCASTAAAGTTERDERFGQLQASPRLMKAYANKQRNKHGKHTNIQTLCAPQRLFFSQSQGTRLARRPDRGGTAVLAVLGDGNSEGEQKRMP